MTRPSRYPGVSLVKLEAYVHPDAVKALERRADGRPIGLVLDRMLGIGKEPDVGWCGPVAPLYDIPQANKSPVHAGSPIRAESTRAHTWKDSGALGKVCATCGKSKRAAEGTNCVSMAENPPEEAHLTQKGPK